MNNKFIAAVAAIGFAAAMDASALTYTIDFQQYGQNVNLGPTKTFTSGPVSIAAAGFTTGGSSVDLFAKYSSGNPSETGLGLANDLPDHEINTSSFVQLALPPGGPVGTTLDVVLTGSLQTGETADIRLGTANGVLGSTVIGTHSGGDTWSFNIPAADNVAGNYIDITADNGNVLLDSVQISTPSVPDGGLTVAMLGGALTLLGFARRKLVA
jgi:fibronectin-binding autotransporter adhesin